jgi:cytochrome c peroxidase
MKPNYAIQQAAYKYAVENSGFFDDPRVKNGIDRVVVPEINPEEMMYTEKEPIIHTDQPVDNNCYKTSEFLDASKVSLESSEYRKNRWRPENWDEEALYLFARAAEQMPLDP